MRSSQLAKMNCLDSKKSFGNVEIVISLMIFVTFVSFLLIFINPFQKSQDSSQFLGITELKIKENAKINFSYVSLKLTTSSDCFSIDKIKEGNVVVKNFDGDSVSSGANWDKIGIDSDEDFYYIYFSDEFESSSYSCSNYLNKSEYNLGILNSVQVYSLGKFEELADEYQNSYSSLKDRLGLVNDFGFKVTGEGVEIDAIKNTNNMQVDAIELPIQVLDDEANLKVVILNVQVWS